MFFFSLPPVLCHVYTTCCYHLLPGLFWAGSLGWPLQQLTRSRKRSEALRRVDQIVQAATARDGHRCAINSMFWVNLCVDNYIYTYYIYNMYIICIHIYICNMYIYIYTIMFRELVYFLLCLRCNHAIMKQTKM